MPKPATVEDEEPSPVSPLDEKPVLPDLPVFQSFKLPSPTDAPEMTEAPEASSKLSCSEKTFYAGSVAEIQRGFEELLINQPRSSTTSTMITPPMAPCCSQFKREIPSMFHHKEAPRMNNCSSTEIPVTRGTAARDKWFAELAGLSNERQQAHTATAASAAPTVSIFSVYCNNCSESIPDEHYHCSTCDDGDYDLCQNCVNQGVLCGGEDHWMIKRFVKNGKVINSTTETIAPKPAAAEPKAAPIIPEDLEVPVATRTCNSCIQGKPFEQFRCLSTLLNHFLELSEENFVTCTSCPDFDLCISCHVGMEHGHHPKHAFEPAVEDTQLDFIAKTLLAPGRNIGHNAICDGCDKVCCVFTNFLRNHC
jgi:next to BRCA1 gene 1 protein